MATIPFNENAVVETGPGGPALKPVGMIGPGTSPAPAPQAPAVKSSVAPKVASPVDQSGYTPSGLFINSDGSINYEKSLESAKQKALEIQKQAEQLKAKQDTGTQSFVSSSAPVVQQEKNTTNDVKNLLATITPSSEGASAAQSASDQYLKLLDDQMKALEDRRTKEIEQINKNFDSAKVGLQDTQKRESGTTSAMLARAGGFLGNSGSGTGVLLTLAQNHKAELTTLEGKRASAIQEANNAIDDKQFALARMKVQEVKDIEKTIYDRKRNFFQDSLSAIQEARQQDEFYRTKIKDDLEMLGKLGAQDEKLELDPAKAAEIDAYYGTPGFTQQYLTTISKAAKAKAQKEQLEAQSSLLDLLEKIPAGEKVTFPDGTSYTGLGSAGDIYTTVETDDAGISRLVTVDKRTKKVTVSSLGKIGKSDSGGGGSDDTKATVEDNVTSELQIQLEASKLGDGTYDPDVYIRERKDIKEAFPTLVAKMDAKFLNPSNGFFTTDAITQLRKKGIFAPTPSDI